MHLTSEASRLLETAWTWLLVCATYRISKDSHMDEMTRKKLEMGKRALEFCRAHPDSNPQFVAAVARLEALLARAEELQREEEQEQTTRQPSGSGSDGKVIPFEPRSRPDPTDPAA
jgi:hypothetical protein